MSKYDFKTLSPYEFEVLTRDLLQKELNLTLENFKLGRDKGIDLRYIRNGANIIIQCKHYANSTFNDLLNALKKEVEKVEKLSPNWYIISTSLFLSPEQKSKIANLFPDNILNECDIYDGEYLNNLLTKFPEVEKNNFKLWLSSTSVLEHLLHSDIYNRSAYFLDKIKRKIKLFVPNESLPKALEILKDNNYVVISGAPGVGKTTLAEILIWQHLEKDYELIEISDDVNNAWNCLKEDKKQIFYFDDFLGQTTLQKALNKNEEGRIIDFIEKIRTSKNKKFILTTREYILNEAKLYYERLSNFEFEKCIIDLQQYTDKIKALILYNHLHFSDLTKEHFENIIQDDRYLSIIKHKNYNPRIIEHLTKTSKTNANNYYEEFIDNLNNPMRIWQLAFNKLDDVSKSILLSLAMCLLTSFYSNIQNMSQIIHEKIFKRQKFNKIQYNDGLKILNGDFIIPKEYTISFSNPSIMDFIENYIIQNDLLNEILDIMNTKEQVRWFYYRYIFKMENKNLCLCFLNKITNINFYDNFTFHDALFNMNIALELIIKLNEKTNIVLLNDYFEYVLKKASYAELSITYFEDVIKSCSDLFLEEEDIVISFVHTLKTTLLKNEEEFNSFEDYLALNTFIDCFDTLFKEQEKSELQTNFKNKTDIIIEQLLVDCTSSHQVEELIEKLEEVDGIFEYDNLDLVYEKLDELKEREDAESETYDVDSWEGYSDNKETSNPNEEIKDMFDSLLT